MKTILSLAFAAVAFGTFGEIDARLPEKISCAAVVDFDALRPQLPQVDAWIRAGFPAESTNGISRIKTQSTAYDMISRQMQNFFAECALSPANVHWAVLAVQNSSLKVSRNRQINSSFFQIALKAEKMPWDRILEWAGRNRCDCSRKRVFGQTVHDYVWRPDFTSQAPVSFSVVPSENDLSFISNGGFSLWNAYFDSAKTDDLYADLGRLEPGEVARVILTDLSLQVLSVSLGEIVGAELPKELLPALAGFRRAVLSLYLADAKVGARFRFSIVDSAVAERIRAWIALVLEKKSASNRKALFRPTVSVEGSQVVIDTGRCDAAEAFHQLVNLNAETGKGMSVR